MSIFRAHLAQAHATHGVDVDDLSAARTTIFVPYDQLTDAIGPLSRVPPQHARIVVVEAPAKAARRPYHKQKLALVLANLRHFALEQARRGVHVVHVVDDDAHAPYRHALQQLGARGVRMSCMSPAERELRVELQPLVDDGTLQAVPHEGFLSAPADLDAASHDDGHTFRMDAFWRAIRQRTGVLMDGGRPIGGKWSFDVDNRLSWDGTPTPPTPPVFAPDDVTREVCDLVHRAFAQHPGTLDPTALPTTADDAATMRAFARACLPSFGPYEDAMSTQSRGLFHTRLAPLLNLHRVLPRDVVEDALASEAPLPSREGFVRQVLGWREFVFRIHERTDGFRRLPGKEPTVVDDSGHAMPSALHAHEPLPPAYWPGAPSGLACLDHCVDAVWRDGWTHHIPRLMVLGNIATLLDVEPRALTDWFWVAFIDAFDWVVEPNVLAMATYGAGDVMTTKPYVAGSAYVDKMSDFCGSCAFHPKKSCPLTSLYWAFLARHHDVLVDNDRMALVLGSLRRRAQQQQVDDARVYQITRAALTRRERLTPAHFSASSTAAPRASHTHRKTTKQEPLL